MIRDVDDGSRNWQEFEALRREHDAEQQSPVAAPVAPLTRRSIGRIPPGSWTWRWLRRRSDLRTLFFRPG